MSIYIVEKLGFIHMLKLWTPGMCYQATSNLLKLPCLTFTNVHMKRSLESWRGCHFTPLSFYNRPMVQPNHAVLHEFDGGEIIIIFFVIACSLTCSIYVYKSVSSKKVRDTLFVKRRHFYLLFQVSLKVNGL